MQLRARAGGLIRLLNTTLHGRMLAAMVIVALTAGAAVGLRIAEQRADRATDGLDRIAAEPVESADADGSVEIDPVRQTETADAPAVHAGHQHGDTGLAFLLSALFTGICGYLLRLMLFRPKRRLARNFGEDTPSAG